MNGDRLRLFGLGFALLFLLSACTTPNLYRPEVDMFQKATSEIESYVKAKRNSVEGFRTDLRGEVFESQRPQVTLSESCDKAIANLNKSANDGSIPDLSVAAECKLMAVDNEKLSLLYNPEEAFENSVAFAAAVGAYALSLDRVAQSGNKEAFLEATKGLNDAVISLAGSAAEAANMKKPDPETFTPIANFVAHGAYYLLERQKTKALQMAAKEAHTWIEMGSKAVVNVMLSTQFEIAQPSIEKVREQIDKVNEANEKTYLSEADKAINYTIELRRQLSFDPGLPFRKLPVAHQKLLDAFQDRKRHIAAAIVVAQDLYNAAKDAYDAVKKKEKEE